MSMAEEKEIILDTKILSLENNELVKFALFLKAEKAKIGGGGKVR